MTEEKCVDKVELTKIIDQFIKGWKSDIPDSKNVIEIDKNCIKIVIKSQQLSINTNIFDILLQPIPMNHLEIPCYNIVVLPPKSEDNVFQFVIHILNNLKVAFDILNLHGELPIQPIVTVSLLELKFYAELYNSHRNTIILRCDHRIITELLDEVVKDLKCETFIFHLTVKGYIATHSIIKYIADHSDMFNFNIKIISSSNKALDYWHESNCEYLYNNIQFQKYEKIEEVDIYHEKLIYKYKK